MSGQVETMKYFLIIIFLFFGLIYIVINYAVHKPSPMSYDDEIRKEFKEYKSELKMLVFESCAVSRINSYCKHAIELCNKDQDCQNMTTTYQLSINGSPELNDLSFINASKDYVNIERAKMGLPPVK